MFVASWLKLPLRSLWVAHQKDSPSICPYLVAALKVDLVILTVQRYLLQNCSSLEGRDASALPRSL